MITLAIAIVVVGVGVAWLIERLARDRDDRVSDAWLTTRIRERRDS